MRLLEELGFGRVAYYGEGVVGWRRAKLPFDTGRERSVRPEHFAEPAEVAPPGP